MAYIGKQPTVGNFVKLDAITTSATTTFNLTNGGVAYSPQSANHCIVSLNGVIQSPNTSFTISGSTIVFASALTASDVIDFILVLGDVLNIGTPSDATVGFSKITSNLITGATAETSIADADTLLIYDDSATALRKMTKSNLFSGISNNPSFRAYRSTNQTITNNTDTIITFNAETFDTDNAFNTTNGRFTVPAGKAGKYFFFAQCRWNTGTDFDNYNINIKVNGSRQHYGGIGRNEAEDSFAISSILDLAVNDYVEIAVYHALGSNLDVVGSTDFSYFFGYKLI